MHSKSWLILLAVVLYGILHSLLASMWLKDQAQVWFGESVKRWYRLVYNLIGFISFLPILALVTLLPDYRYYAIRPPWLYLSLTGQVLAILVLVAAVRQTGAWSFMGLKQILGKPSVGSQHLEVGGLYSFVRHPIYSAGIIFIWLTPVMTANILMLNIGLSVYFVIGAWFEERKLLREFAEEYAEYRKCTPMLIPALCRHPSRIDKT
jgi:protein-S-isoprenylcysteine O-methyltransferase Ste14